MADRLTMYSIFITQVSPCLRFRESALLRMNPFYICGKIVNIQIGRCWHKLFDIVDHKRWIIAKKFLPTLLDDFEIDKLLLHDFKNCENCRAITSIPYIVLSSRNKNIYGPHTMYCP